MFQGFTLEYREDRTILYPYGKDFKTACVYLENDNSYVAHANNSNKLGNLPKPREQLTLKDLQELCKLVVSDKK